LAPEELPAVLRRLDYRAEATGGAYRRKPPRRQRPGVAPSPFAALAEFARRRRSGT
jgi:hypothetical protein